MSDFKERLLNERQELSIKIGKLAQFLNGEKVSTISANQLRYLSIQYHIMTAYESVLSCRINDLEEAEAIHHT